MRILSPFSSSVFVLLWCQNCACLREWILRWLLLFNLLTQCEWNEQNWYHVFFKYLLKLTREATQAWNFLWEKVLNYESNFFNKYRADQFIYFFLSEFWWFISIKIQKRSRQQRMRQLDNITDSMDMSLSKLQKIVKDRGVWCAGVQGATKKVRHNLTTGQQ